MTTNKQSEKRESSIMVIEDKTLKTLTKKENKMKNEMNNSLNKSMKATKKFKSFPTYAFNKNSRLRIELPNGMDMVLYSDSTGNFCHVHVDNHNRTENYKMKSNTEEVELSNFTTQDNEFRYFDKNVSFGFEFCKFNNK